MQLKTVQRRAGIEEREMVGAVDVEQRAQRSLVRKVCVVLVASGLALVLVSRSSNDAPTTPGTPAVAPAANR